MLLPFSHLKGTAHFTVELILLLCHLHVVLRSCLDGKNVFTIFALKTFTFHKEKIFTKKDENLDCPGKVRVDASSIRVEVAVEDFNEETLMIRI